MNDRTLKTGTTTIGIKYKDGILLAADKQMTAGMQIIAHMSYEKIILVNDRVALTIAGSVSEVQLLTKVIRAQLKLEELRRGKHLSNKESANLLSNLVYGNARKMSMIPAIAGFLMAGVDKNGFNLYSVEPSGSVVEYDNFACDGSGMLFALGVLDAEYKAELTLEQAKQLAIKTINSAVRRDAFSGGGIDIVNISKNGTERIYTKLLDNSL